MKTYLVPIDFSEAAFNAAHYAAQLSHQTDVERIILINAYYVSPYESLLPNADMMMLRESEVEEEAGIRIGQLETLKYTLQSRVKEGVIIQTRLHRSHLLRAVVDAVAQNNVGLVILGSIGNSTVREKNIGIGSHVIAISKTCPVPVMVVPPAYKYQRINTALVACDFKKVKDSVPAEALHKLLDKRNIKLLVVHAVAKGKQGVADAETLAEETALHQMLKDLKPEYYYINDPEIIKGVLDFAVEKGAQMVIALPHTYSFLQSILHNSISQQLAASSPVPVLLLK
ncbi:universal stress protein [Mucilaginibacter sp.]|uniref:universal stress protein n=1 Tax=Mucilaginibacter sp. TaxID=1882438 RepID=UPI003266E4EC